MLSTPEPVGERPVPVYCASAVQVVRGVETVVAPPLVLVYVAPPLALLVDPPPLAVVVALPPPLATPLVYPRKRSSSMRNCT